MSKPKVIIRADGNSQIGLGHVIRSLALAEMLSSEFECHFIIRNPLPSLREQIQSVCQTIRELPETDDDITEAHFLANEVLSGEEIVVLDGYHFQTEYQRIIKERGNKLVCIDDIYAYHFLADVVINHAPGISKAEYSTESYCELCLGLDYALLRKPFIEASRENRDARLIKNVFLCMGGSDSKNLTSKILVKSLENSHFESYYVVLGAANKNARHIKQIKNAFPDKRIIILHALNPIQMIEVIRKCDLAIVPASSILFEVIAVKIPVISGYYVDNQTAIYKGFKSLGMIVGIGDLNDFSSLAEAIRKAKEPLFIKKCIQAQKRFRPEKSKENFLKIFESLFYEGANIS